MITDRILVSEDNAVTILLQIFDDLILKIKNKDISLPYTTQLNKSLYLKIDGNGDMFLNNGGQYISIGSITQDILDIDKINERFNIVNQKEKWDNIKTSVSNANFACEYYNGKIYAIFSSNIYTYDILSNTWSNIYTLPYGRIAPSSILYRDKIYIVAGMNGNNDLLQGNTLGVYDIANNKYDLLPNMISPRDTPGCIEYNGKIYCIGGYNGGARNDIQVYDISTNTWSNTYSNMNNIRCAFGCTLYNNKIYVVGGYTQTGSINNVEVYDILSNTWTSLSPMNIKSSVLYATAYNNKLYCMRGGNTNIDIYDINSNTWGSGLAMDKFRNKFGHLTIDNKIYCLLGVDNYGNTLSDISIYNMPKVSFDIPIPDVLYSKLSKIITNGNGSKVFRNDGTYKEIVPDYQTMTTDNINAFLLNIQERS